MIERTLTRVVQERFQQYPVVTITGPRQSGKTTLARRCFPHLPYRNLEHPETREFASDDPVHFLESLPEGAIIDEIQNVPELTSYIQVEVDEKQQNGRYVLTGSRQFNMMEAVTQSLAGRTAIIKLLPFSLEELEGQYYELGTDTKDYLFRGFYPRLYEQKLPLPAGLSDYVETYIERDLRQISRIQDLMLFRKFLKLCAGRTGQLLNFSHLAEDTGISHKTAAEWISLLETSFIVFRLPPYFANISKRLIKSPKLYFYDTGLAAHLMGIENPSQLETHPLRGALFETMVITELLKYRYHRGLPENLSFFRDAKGHEVDLLYRSGNEISLFEIKAAGTVRKDFFKGLTYFDQYIHQASRKVMIYDGDRHEERSTAFVTTPREMRKLLEVEST